MTLKISLSEEFNEVEIAVSLSEITYASLGAGGRRAAAG
jgi:hypothetical protein